MPDTFTTGYFSNHKMFNFVVISASPQVTARLRRHYEPASANQNHNLQISIQQGVNICSLCCSFQKQQKKKGT